MKSPPYARPLGRLERFLWHAGEIGCANCAVVMKVDGGLEEAYLRRALLTMQQRYLVLRATVAETGGMLRYAPDETGQTIPLLVHNTRDWRREVARQLAAPFAPGEAPLVRGLWFPVNDRRAVLSFVAPHAIVDGQTAVGWFKEALDCVSGNGGIAPSSPAPEPPPLEDLYPSRLNGLRGWLRLGWAVWRGRMDALREGAPRQIPGFDASYTPQQNPRFLALEFDKKTTAALVSRCYAAKAGVQGALAAAQLLALAREVPGQERVLAVTSTVDLRRFFDRSRQVRTPGVYMALVVTAHRVGPQTGFWDLARAVRKKLYAGIRRGDAHVGWHLLRLVPPTSAGVRRFARLMRFAPPSTVVSTIGTLPALRADPHLTVRSLWFAMCPFPTVPLLTMADVYDGRLFLTLNYDGLKMPDERVRRIGERMCEYLRSSIAS